MIFPHTGNWRWTLRSWPLCVIETGQVSDQDDWGRGQTPSASWVRSRNTGVCMAWPTTTKRFYKRCRLSIDHSAAGCWSPITDGNVLSIKPLGLKTTLGKVFFLFGMKLDAPLDRRLHFWFFLSLTSNSLHTPIHTLIIYRTLQSIFIHRIIYSYTSTFQYIHHALQLNISSFTAILILNSRST